MINKHLWNHKLPGPQFGVHPGICEKCEIFFDHYLYNDIELYWSYVHGETVIKEFENMECITDNETLIKRLLE